MVNADAIDVAVAINTDPDSLGVAQAVEFATDVAGSTMIEDTLGGLAANTQYYYKIYYRPASLTEDAHYLAYTSPGGDDVFDFYTARDPGETFVFTVSSDEHGQAEIAPSPTAQAKIAKVYDNCVADSTDFHITLGDHLNINAFCSFGCTTYEAVKATHLYMRDQIGWLSAHCPWFTAIGNREHEEGWRIGDADSINAWTVRARLKLWPNPQPGGFYSGDTTQTIYGRREGYYSWEWGDALLVMLDAYSYTATNPMENPPDAWEWTLGEDQYNWLYETLSESDATWKIVFGHQLISSSMGGVLKAYGRGGAEIAKHSIWGWGSYEWGGEDSLGVDQYASKRPGWSHGSIHDMLDSTRAQLVIKGHDHGYCYQDQADSVIYVTIPKVIQESSTYGFVDNAFYYPDTTNNVIRYSTGHLRVTVYGPDSLRCEYVRAVLGTESPLIEGADSVYNRDVSHSFTLYP